MLTPHFSFAIKPVSVVARLLSALSHAASAGLPLDRATRWQQQTGHFLFRLLPDRQGALANKHIPGCTQDRDTLAYRGSFSEWQLPLTRLAGLAVERSPGVASTYGGARNIDLPRKGSGILLPTSYDTVGKGGL